MKELFRLKESRKKLCGSKRAKRFTIQTGHLQAVKTTGYPSLDEPPSNQAVCIGVVDIE